ncbi:hypothetical protein EG857_15115, partial [Enterococcus faecalis]
GREGCGREGCGREGDEGTADISAEASSDHASAGVFGGPGRGRLSARLTRNRVARTGVQSTFGARWEMCAGERVVYTRGTGERGSSPLALIMSSSSLPPWTALPASPPPDS